jgi:cobalt-zinc-cadmium efflux system protein
MSHDAHHHGHDHHDHHTHAAASSGTRVFVTFWIIALFMVVEAIGGWWTGSLTLLADAGHMLTDAGALALAWFAARALQRPSDLDRSYGHDRFSVLAALVNGLGLIGIVVVIAVEAVRRLLMPESVLAGPMLAIAGVGLLVNCAAFVTLHGADRDNLNIHAALLHVLGDILASLAAVTAAIIILLTGWTIADPILSALAGALILRNALALVGRSWRVLMEATPEGIDVTEIADTLRRLEGVADIHHLHAWALAPGKPLITLHARAGEGHAPDAVLARLKQALVTGFQIAHSTIQMEGACADHEVRPGSSQDCGGPHSPDFHTHKQAAAR